MDFSKIRMLPFDEAFPGAVGIVIPNLMLAKFTSDTKILFSWKSWKSKISLTRTLIIQNLL